MKYELKKIDDSDFPILDQNGVSFPSVNSWLWTGILGGCGCGSSEDLADEAFKVLVYYATSHEQRDLKISPYEKMDWEIIAHWMNDKNIIEHGSSIGSGWLTEKGKEIYDAIKRVKQIYNNG